MLSGSQDQTGLRSTLRCTPLVAWPQHRQPLVRATAWLTTVCGYTSECRYLSYKVAQVLGFCHVPPVVPMALKPGIETLVTKKVFKYHHKSSKKPRLRCAPTACWVCLSLMGLSRLSVGLCAGRNCPLFLQWGAVTFRSAWQCTLVAMVLLV